MQTPDRPTVLWPPVSQPGGKANIDAGYARHLIYSIFTAGSVRQFLLSKFAKDEQEQESLSILFGQLRGFFSDNLAKTMKEPGIARIDKDLIEQAENLALFEREFLVDSIRYQASSSPTRTLYSGRTPCQLSHPSSLFGARPIVENFGLMDKSTPVGSAGSCFVSEIAYYLQNKGYNYVITESDEADGPQPGSCARWGLFFNTASFKQLAEKAFCMRALPKLAEFHPAGNYWQDPFRENIPFWTPKPLKPTVTRICVPAAMPSKPARFSSLHLGGTNTGSLNATVLWYRAIQNHRCTRHFFVTGSLRWRRMSKT